jgi:hypothetical protein
MNNLGEILQKQKVRNKISEINKQQLNNIVIQNIIVKNRMMIQQKKILEMGTKENILQELKDYRILKEKHANLVKEHQLLKEQHDNLVSEHQLLKEKSQSQQNDTKAVRRFNIY